MGTWNKLGHVDKNCKPCNDPPVPMCYICIIVQGCGTNFGDGTHLPVPGAFVKWSWHGDTSGKTQGSCTTDSTGKCCVSFPSPPASYTDKSLTFTVTADGYNTFTGGMQCPTSQYVSSLITIVPNRTYVTFQVEATNGPYQAFAGCTTVTWPGGSCVTDQHGKCSGYADLSVPGTASWAGPAKLASGTGYLGPVSPTPCKIGDGMPTNCAADYISVNANYDPLLNGQLSGGLDCLSQDGLIATVAGQSIPLQWNAVGAWGGCGVLPAYTTIDWVPCPLCGGCGGGAEHYTTRDLPFSVTFDTQTTLQIRAPICSKVHGLPSKLDIHQSYMYDGTNAPNVVGVYASCDPARWPSLQFSGGPGGPGCTYCVYGEMISTGASLFVDTSGWIDTGETFCTSYKARGTIPPGLQGLPAYIINPFAGPCSVEETAGRGGPVARSGGGGGPNGPAGGGGPVAGRVGPSLARKAANFAGAVATHVAHGRPQTSPTEAARRIAVCESCLGPAGLWDAARRSCLHPKCGCNMDLKVTWADMSCPIGRWSAIHQEK